MITFLKYFSKRLDYDPPKFWDISSLLKLYIYIEYASRYTISLKTKIVSADDLYPTFTKMD